MPTRQVPPLPITCFGYAEHQAALSKDPIERYSKTTVLRALLTHDPALGGVAIKLVSVRWLITYFQATPPARLEHHWSLPLPPIV